ncbi:unnamed protein product [Boreogadus saida]
MAERTVAQLLREAATALDEQRGVGSATNMPAPDRTGEGRANRGEVVRMFRPYQAPHQRRPHPPRRTPKTQSFTHRFFCLTGRRQEEVPNPSERFLLERAGLREKKITFPDIFCTATEFTAILLLNYPALRDCGGYQLLRARGTTRSKCLIPIDCPREGYTPHYLCSTANIGQAILYARPLQRDIDLETISQTEEPGPHTQCEVECMFCGQVINMASIQDHIDVCESSHQQSTSAAQTSAQSSAAQSSAQSAAQSAAPTSASQSAAPTSAAQSSAQSSAPTSAAQSSAQSSASTSAAQSSAQSSASTSAAQSSAQSSASTSAAQSSAQSSASTSAAQSSAQSSASTSAAQSSASTSAAQTSAASTSSTGRVSDICNEEWKLEPDTKAAAKMFQTHLLKDADPKPTLKLTLDMHVTEEDRERAIIGFYKQTNIDWTRPFEVQLKGLHLHLDYTGGKTILFTGAADHLVPSTSLPLLQGDLFRVAGRIIGHSFLNRGPLLSGMGQCLFPLLASKDMGAIDAAVLQLDDCPDLDIVEIVSLTTEVQTDHHSTSLAEMLPGAIEEWGLMSKDPAIVTDNAFNMKNRNYFTSALEMLERFLEQQPAISAALLSPEVRRNERDLCTLKEDDITDAEDVVKALKPMKRATQEHVHFAHKSHRRVPMVVISLAQGRKRPGKVSATQIEKHLVVFMKSGTSVQEHVDAITSSTQPYLLAIGMNRATIHEFFIVIDKQAIPCRSTSSLGAFDKLFKTHFVFGIMYNQMLQNMYTFVQTTVFNIDSGDADGEENVAPQPPEPDPVSSSALECLLGEAFKEEEAAPKSPTEKAEDEILLYRARRPAGMHDNPLTWWRE